MKPSFSLVSPATLSRGILVCLLFGPVARSHASPAEPARAKHVLVLGCDGLGSIGFTGQNAPVLHKLMREGAYTLRARGVIPTSSSPNWASMIMGAGPEQHGVTSQFDQVFLQAPKSNDILARSRWRLFQTTDCIVGDDARACCPTGPFENLVL